MGYLWYRCLLVVRVLVFDGELGAPGAPLMSPAFRLRPMCIACSDTTQNRLSGTIPTEVGLLQQLARL